jgi:hypothetical protein
MVRTLHCNKKFLPVVCDSKISSFFWNSFRLKSLRACDGTPSLRISAFLTSLITWLTGTDLVGFPVLSRIVHGAIRSGMKNDIAFFANSRLELLQCTGLSFGPGVGVPYAKFLKWRAVSSGVISNSFSSSNIIWILDIHPWQHHQ